MEMQVNRSASSRVMMSLVLVREEVDREMKICVNDGRISFTCSESAASGLQFLPDRTGTRRALARDAQCYHAGFVIFFFVRKISTILKYSIPPDVVNNMRCIHEVLLQVPSTSCTAQYDGTKLLRHDVRQWAEPAIGFNSRFPVPVEYWKDPSQAGPLDYSYLVMVTRQVRGSVCGSYPYLLLPRSFLNKVIS